MTTGRINQVTILNAAAARRSGAPVNGAEQFTGRGATPPAGQIPGALLQQGLGQPSNCPL